MFDGGAARFHLSAICVCLMIWLLWLKKVEPNYARGSLDSKIAPNITFGEDYHLELASIIFSRKLAGVELRRNAGRAARLGGDADKFEWELRVEPDPVEADLLWAVLRAVLPDQKAITWRFRCGAENDILAASPEIYLEMDNYPPFRWVSTFPHPAGTSEIQAVNWRPASRDKGVQWPDVPVRTGFYAFRTRCIDCHENKLGAPYNNVEISAPNSYIVHSSVSREISVSKIFYHYLKAQLPSAGRLEINHTKIGPAETRDLPGVEKAAMVERARREWGRPSFITTGDLSTIPGINLEGHMSLTFLNADE